MSGEGGLQKLTEYLNQTRRQAETAIDTLNERIYELETSNAALSKANDELNIERSYLKDTIEQLKGENSRKWRLQERDDWKSLVDSVQADRVRLQEENMQLTLQLEAANEELHRMSFPLSPDENAVSQVKLSSDSYDGFDSHMAPAVDENGNNLSVRVSRGCVDCDRSGNRIPHVQTEVVDGSISRPSSVCGPMSSQPGSPSVKVSSGVIQQLKLEIEKINNQRIVEKQIADAEISGLKDEIERLQRQLELAQVQGADMNLDFAQHLVNSQTSDKGQNGAASELLQPKWSLSFGLWDYFFTASEAPNSRPPDAILRV